MLRWKVLEPLNGRGRPRRGAFQTPSVDNDGSTVAGPGLTWIGHATFAARLGGQTIVTDPVWSRSLHGVVPRLVAPGVAFEAMPKIDVVLISHNHYDHLDAPTLKRIGPDALYVVPEGNGPLLRRLGLPKVVELDWWQRHTHGELEITCVPARHWSMRMPWDRNDGLWGGFVVAGPEATVYHSGDTGLFDDFAEIGQRCGPIDYAMLPIGAYEPRWFMEPQHMNPDDAVSAFEMLGAKHLVGMHWGTFVLTDEPLAEPPERTEAIWKQRSYDQERLLILPVGGHRAF